MDPEWRDKFDVALSCGAFMKNNAPPSGFDEMVESIKKGGVVAISVREDEWIELGFKGQPPMYGPGIRKASAKRGCISRRRYGT